MSYSCFSIQSTHKDKFQIRKQTIFDNGLVHWEAHSPSIFSFSASLTVINQYSRHTRLSIKRYGETGADWKILASGAIASCRSWVRWDAALFFCAVIFTKRGDRYLIGITKFLLLFCVPFLCHGQTNSLLHRNVLDVTQGSHFFFFFFWGGGGEGWSVSWHPKNGCERDYQTNWKTWKRLMVVRTRYREKNLRKYLKNTLLRTYYASSILYISFHI